MEIALREEDSKTILGFWLYIMSDCILFGVLFAVYAVLHDSTFGGPPAGDLLSPTFGLIESLILLVSSFTVGPPIIAARRNEKGKVLAWIGITFILGLVFIVFETIQLTELVVGGNSWQRSAFLSSFFTLVGVHGAHILAGLLWMLVLMGQIMSRGLSPEGFKRIWCLQLFWHFLNIVWIFIFTIVYMMGVL